MLWQDLKPGSVGLAPMAGITDSPFRQLCREYGADFVMSEMISAVGVCLNQTQEMWDLETNSWTAGSKSLEYARLTDKERPVILQIFGNDPAKMAKAARIIIDRFSPDGIDINMGCPVRKVMKTGSGVALMDKPELAARIVQTVKKAIKGTPLSVKTRLGVKDNNIAKLAPLLADAGADALIIHGRRQADLFKGPVDYATIGEVTKLVGIPVIANGGIVNQGIHTKVIAETNARATIIGQAAKGNPFIFKQIKDPSYQPTWKEKVKTIIRHTALQIDYRQDETYALKEMRKHYAWYIKGLKNAAQWRQKLVRVTTLNEVKEILLDIDG
ncbi:tRNA dihydrouridine synthase [Patescibacteria group bacterium]